MDTTPAAAAASEPAPVVPGVVDLSLLHRGGFGTVYRGHQFRFGRDVAVKVLHDGGSQAVRVRRFERECAVLGRFSGLPNVLRVLDSGYLHGGGPYLVTELCTGGSLADRVRAGGPLPVAEAVAIGQAVAAVLAELHAADVLHRDVTPANVLLRAGAEPVLADFGLAVHRGEADIGPDAASPGHVAPEASAERRWSPASAGVSLGSTLAALLGVDRSSPNSGGVVPPGLAEVIARMCAVDPAVRPSAAVVADRLAALGGTQPVALPMSTSAPVPMRPGSPRSPGSPGELPTQPVAAPAIRSRPTAPGRRLPTRTLVAATVVAGIAAATVGLVAAGLVPGHRSASGASGTSGPPSRVAGPPATSVTSSTTSPTSPAPSPTSPATSPARTLAAGYRLVRGAQGLQVPVPASWHPRPVAGTAELRATDPARPPAFVQFGGYRPGHASQLERVRGYASGEGAGYQQIRLTRVRYGNSPDAVLWEYRYLIGGRPQHAEGVYWRSGHAEYVVYASAPQDRWAPVLGVLQAMLRGSTPR